MKLLFPAGSVLVGAAREHRVDDEHAAAGGAGRELEPVPDVQLLHQPHGVRRAALQLPAGSVSHSVAPRRHRPAQSAPRVSESTKFITALRFVEQLSLLPV